MENPLIRINSNGRQTEVYYNGEKIKYGKQVLFFAVPFDVFCEVFKHKVENGKPVFNKNNEEFEIENVVLFKSNEIDYVFKEYCAERFSEKDLNELVSMWQKYHSEEPK